MERKFDNNDSDSNYTRRDSADRYDNARREGSRPRIVRENNGYNQRPRYNSNEDGEHRSRYNKSYNNTDDNNYGERRPRFNRNYNNDGNSYNRPRYNNDSEDGERRPRFNRNYNNDGNSYNRPRYNNDSEDGERRPRFNKNYNNADGNSYGNQRPRYNNNGDGEHRQRFNKDGGQQRPRINNNNRQHTAGNQNGRPQKATKPKSNKGYSESRPRYSRDKGFYNYERNFSSQKSSITEDLFVENEIAANAGTQPELPNKMRLNRYIAMAGICSRREADELIKKGLVKVNGNVVTEMGVTVQKEDIVEYEGRTLAAERKVYVLLNKPKDTVTTTDDPEERRTVMDLVAGACEERIYPVGRLDRNTTGVILLTNDGEMTERLMHPKYGVRKIYHVFLDKAVNENDMRRMIEGLTLEDGPIAVDDVRYVDANDKKQVGVQIHSGRNRIVRRVFEHLGYSVEKLDRVYFAGLTKLNLPRGKWRFLTDAEINKLKAGFYK